MNDSRIIKKKKTRQRERTIDHKTVGRNGNERENPWSTTAKPGKEEKWLNEAQPKEPSHINKYPFTTIKDQQSSEKKITRKMEKTEKRKWRANTQRLLDFIFEIRFFACIFGLFGSCCRSYALLAGSLWSKRRLRRKKNHPSQDAFPTVFFLCDVYPITLIHSLASAYTNRTFLTSTTVVMLCSRISQLPTFYVTPRCATQNVEYISQLYTGRALQFPHSSKLKLLYVINIGR